MSKKKKNATLPKSLGCEILSSGSGRRLDESDMPSRLRTLAFLTSCSVQSPVVSVTSRTRFEHRPAKTNPAVKTLHFQDTRRRGERVKSPNSSNYALLFFHSLAFKWRRGESEAPAAALSRGFLFSLNAEASGKHLKFQGRLFQVDKTDEPLPSGS